MSDRVPRKLIVGNWKMNLTESAARSLVVALRDRIRFDRVDAAVAPAFPCLRAVLDAVAGTPLAVAAQNAHWEDRGAFTGEVAPPMLVEMGVRYVILGHSERRALFGETDATVARKVPAVIRNGLTPILCVGETAVERARGLTEEVVVAQLRAALADVPASAAAGLVVAYEPVWAIGTGRTPSPSDVSAAHRALRSALGDRLGAAGADVRILYGGSATAANAASLLGADEVGGALVGGASLDPISFGAITEIA